MQLWSKTPRDVWRYCQACGAEMTWRDDPFDAGYDRQSGRHWRRAMRHWACPLWEPPRGGHDVDYGRLEKVWE